MIAAVSVAEAVHGIGLAMTTKQRWVDAVFALVTAAKYVYTHHAPNVGL